jgi:hypothetical protein
VFGVIVWVFAPLAGGARAVALRGAPRGLAGAPGRTSATTPPA